MAGPGNKNFTMETADKTNVCLKCGSDFSNPFNLRRHVRKFHPDDVDVLAPMRNKNSQNFLFSCSICGKNFNAKNTFTFHMKTHSVPPLADTVISDNDKSKKVKGKVKCSLCDYSVSIRKQMLQHFGDRHQIEIRCKQMEFRSLHAFDEWRAQTERNTKARFVIKQIEKCEGKKTMFYRCHRSGNYVSKGKGLRNLKTQGSSKINGYCPASIKKIEHLNKNNDVEKVEVVYTETHVGHQLDIAHLPLTQTERRGIAAKIASKVCFDEILDEIRDSVANEELKRIHLATKKDLHNIKQCFNLSTPSERHSNDAISLEAFVNKMRCEEDCILFYKPQGVLCEENPNLKKRDFLLVLMNQAQVEFLAKYGSDCVCLDGTHNLNNRYFELNSLIVLDDMREGFPAAFMISNRSDSDVLKLFFSEIRGKVGVVTPDIFMSDLANSAYDAWTSVMGIPQRRSFCCWHADHAWRKKIRFIKRRENQVIIYKQLRALLEERNADTFEIMIQNFCENSNPEFKRFVEYFKENYFSNRKHWAYCYRLHADINRNLQLERLHRAITYAYSRGKRVKRLDQGIAALMTMTRSRLLDRPNVTNKGKISDTLRTAPKSPQNMDSTFLPEVEHSCELPSEVYLDQELEKSCDYQLICSECNVCIQEYRGSCPDSAIKFHLCEHVRLVAQNLSSNIGRR